MKTGLSIIIILLTLGLKAQKMNEYTLTGTREFTYNEEGHKTGKLTYDTLGNLIKSVKYLYDEKENKIGTEKRLADNSLLAVYEYEYDENKLKQRSQKNDFVKHIKSGKTYLNNAIGKSEQTAYYSKGELTKTNYYKYNEKGDVSEMISCNANGDIISKYTYKYCHQSNSFEKETYNKENNLIKLSKYVLDEKGNKIEFYSFYYSGKRRNSKRVYTYNAQGRRITAKVYVVVD
jgi:hypothetical protein